MIRIRSYFYFRIVKSFLLLLAVLILSSVFSVFCTEIKSVEFLNKGSTHISMLILSILLILLLNKGSLKDYGFKLWRLGSFYKIIILSVGIGFISDVLGNILSFSDDQTFPTGNFTLPEIVIYVWLLASIAEEVLFRGLIQSFLNPLKNIKIKLFSKTISFPVIFSAVSFGLIHLALITAGVDIFIVLTIVFFGIILGIIVGYYRENTGSLIPAIIVHMSFNIGSYLGSYLLR